jgi:transposase
MHEEALYIFSPPTQQQSCSVTMDMDHWRKCLLEYKPAISVVRTYFNKFDIGHFNPEAFDRRHDVVAGLVDCGAITETEGDTILTHPTYSHLNHSMRDFLERRSPEQVAKALCVLVDNDFYTMEALYDWELLVLQNIADRNKAQRRRQAETGPIELREVNKRKHKDEESVYIDVMHDDHEEKEADVTFCVMHYENEVVSPKVDLGEPGDCTTHDDADQVLPSSKMIRMAPSMNLTDKMLHLFHAADVIVFEELEYIKAMATQTGKAYKFMDLVRKGICSGRYKNARNLLNVLCAHFRAENQSRVVGILSE